MAAIYYRLVKQGKYKVEQVPTRWRAEVQALLDADEPPAKA